MGDLLGYGRCFFTGESLYQGSARVKYKAGESLIISKKAAQLLPDEIAQKVYDFVIQDDRATPDETSIEKIKELNDLSNLPIYVPGFFESPLQFRVTSVKLVKSD